MREDHRCAVRWALDAYAVPRLCTHGFTLLEGAGQDADASTLAAEGETGTATPTQTGPLRRLWRARRDSNPKPSDP